MAMPISAMLRRGGAALAITGLALAGPARAQSPAPAQMPAVKAGVDAWSRGDFAGAVRDWQGPADAGDADAEFDLGQAYKLGRGVSQDLTRAEALFGQAAAKGHIQASDNYGLLLFQRGAHEQAMPYIQTAAGRGDPRAQYLLGIAYFNGDGIAKDWVRGYAYETMAQQGGLPQAKSALAQMDSYVPIDQRQQGVAMAADLTAQAEATRGRELAAADLGARPANGGGGMVTAMPLPSAAPVVHHVPRPVTPPPPREATLAPTHHAPPPRPTPTPVATNTGGGWKIQLGAFGVAANAEAQWRRAQANGAVAGHARQLIPSGNIHRLMATGFSEAGARAACARLSAAGIACIPARD